MNMEKFQNKNIFKGIGKIVKFAFNLAVISS